MTRVGPSTSPIYKCSVFLGLVEIHVDSASPFSTLYVAPSSVESRPCLCPPCETHPTSLRDPHNAIASTVCDGGDGEDDADEDTEFFVFSLLSDSTCIWMALSWHFRILVFAASKVAFPNPSGRCLEQYRRGIHITVRAREEGRGVGSSRQWHELEGIRF